MKADKPEKYLELDAVADAAGNLGTVYKCFSRANSKSYLRVKIQRGPRTGEWEAPWRFGEPLIHWSETGPTARCARCDRFFRTSLAVARDLRELRCRTCAPIAERAERDAQQAAEAGTDNRERRDLLRRPWRLTDAKRSTGE
jgi:hypothetical protein